MVDVPVAPVWTCRLAGFAVMLKSGVDETMLKYAVTWWERLPLKPDTVNW
jgi:hypothetical protein